ncbi:hypothetical protein [Streptomyces sp. NPDC088733]|uniref:hypothetical protein n=1 Tax=Streptomyces sp. NPDC088733 TaxID=3365880 RepID=UPI0037FB3F64
MKARSERPPAEDSTARAAAPVRRRAAPETPSGTVVRAVDPRSLQRLQGRAGNAAVSGLVTRRTAATAGPDGGLAVQRDTNSTSGVVSQAPVRHVEWTGDPVSMANALRDLLLSGDVERIALSLGMLWVRGMVDTLRMLKLDAGAYAAVTSAAPFTANARLMAALDVVEGRSPQPTADVPADQAVELRAMHDVPDWPRIIGPQARPAVLLPDPDRTPDPVLSDPRYYAALYDAIRRNRALAGQYLLRAVKARPADRVPGGFVYVGPSHKGDRPAGLDAPDPRRKAVNEALWRELGVGEGTQASVNTWDSAKFSFGPGFAATGLLRRVMDNLARSGSDVLPVLRNAGLIYENNQWYVVDPDTRSVASGAAALDVLSKDVGLIGTFLDTAGDPASRRQWMEAEWQAMRSAGGAAAVPDQVVRNWPVDLVVFVAHCVHWGGTTWKDWDSAAPPDLFHVVRRQAAHVPRRTDDPRILTALSARTFLGFSGGLLPNALRLRGRDPGPLPADWSSAFAGAVALPVSDKPLVAHVIEATEESSGPKGADQ